MSNPVPGARALKDPAAAPGAHWEGRALVLPVRVYYHHTDAGGVVYHGTYLDFMEGARIELLNALGFDLAELAEKAHVLFMVYRLEVDYHKPARLNDALAVSAAIIRLGRVRLDFEQRVRRGDEVLVAATVRAACVHPRSFKPVAVPAALAHRLQEHR